ncbi:hypothetical protein M378DRAFT_159391 [Amanita muscaria Koide BX008]|uniref:Uncharacterized protein n=1 Tax=Amanita muscaria (strain Koide BX008) TaxID=946122 RepID=A0A0C2XFF4_AMAMK|nr:hypothetical protein M378DRAFT_159391 [Amanita muscaria Koide BX008]
MYNNSYGTVTNNPFIDDPNNPRNRFPDISATISSPTYQSAQLTSSWAGQPTHQQTYSQYQPQQTQYSVQAQPTGYASFQPTSGFGQQQLASSISGSSYGYLTGQQAPQQTPSYNPAQQQIAANPGYVAQFDPYSSLSQGWDGSASIQSQSFVQTTTTGAPQLQSPTASMSSVSSFIVPSSSQTPTTSRSSSGILHPREFIVTHKLEVESWDSYAWKQLLNTFDSLKDAWETRQKELSTKVAQMLQQMQYATYYQAQQIQQEGSRLQTLLKEAEIHFDSVAASAFQMREVYGGYRQSGDLSSKKRVREATNAALKTIPDWPSPFY